MVSHAAYHAGLPIFEIPNSAVRFVVVALAVGFPIAMLLERRFLLALEA
jgi:hypothetical protein